jgi:hypothetical protein
MDLRSYLAMNPTLSTPPDAAPRFPLGRCVMTLGVEALVTQYGLPVHEFLMRHQRGDWGELDPHDREANEQALKNGARLLSAYTFTLQPEVTVTLWVITEADRRTTTALLPEEY